MRKGTKLSVHPFSSLCTFQSQPAGDKRKLFGYAVGTMMHYVTVEGPRRRMDALLFFRESLRPIRELPIPAAKAFALRDKTQVKGSNHNCKRSIILYFSTHAYVQGIENTNILCLA